LISSELVSLLIGGWIIDSWLCDVRWREHGPPGFLHEVQLWGLRGPGLLGAEFGEGATLLAEFRPPIGDGHFSGKFGGHDSFGVVVSSSQRLICASGRCNASITSLSKSRSWRSASSTVTPASPGARA